MPYTPIKDKYRQNSYRDILRVFKQMLKRLPDSRRKQYWMILLFSLVVAGFEMMALAFTALFATTITNPGAVQTSALAANLQSIVPFPISSIETKDLIIGLACATILLAATKNASLAASKYINCRFTGNNGLYFGRLLYESLLTMPYQWLAANNPASMAIHVNWAIRFGPFMENIAKLINDTVIIAMLFMTTVILQPTVVLTIVALIALLSFALSQLIKKNMNNLSETITHNLLSSQVHCHKTFHGVREVRLFGKEEAFQLEYNDCLRANPQLNAKLLFFKGAPGWFLETLSYVLICVVAIAMLTFYGYSPAKTAGILTMFALAAWRGIPAVIRVLNHITSLQTSLPPLRSVLELFDNIEEEQKNGRYFYKSSGPISFKKDITFKDVDFYYDGYDTPALDSISFSVKAGESIGIIGRSGSGKSTLMDMIIGFLAPTKGSASVDGIVLNDAERVSWMRHVGYVPQTPYIFDGSLSENIAFNGKSETVPTDQILRSCEQAAVSEFLDGLPDGLDTGLGTDGIRLSGGQKQRVCVARALYPEPEVIIFDEATSSLDEKSEQLIQQTIQGLQGRLTMFIVAHRLSTVANCDRIMWLENGKIRQIDSPEVVLPLFRDAQENERRSD